MKKTKKLTITVWLIIINTIFFIISHTPLGNVLPVVSRSGSVYVPGILSGEFWRLFTAMFIHADITHFFSNMIALYALGTMGEKMFGGWRFNLTYMFAGIFGNIVTFTWDLMTLRYYYTVGASGAIFGILGGILAVSVNKKDGIPGANIGRVVIAVVLMFIPQSATISMTAHIGGFIGGFVAMLVLGTMFPRKKTQVEVIG